MFRGHNPYLLARASGSAVRGGLASGAVTPGESSPIRAELCRPRRRGPHGP